MDQTSDIHAEALERAEEAREHWGKIYEDIQDNIDFALNTDNSQWNDNRVYEQSKLKLVINKCESEVDAIVNEMRDSRPAIKIAAADDKADVKTAEVLNDLIRNIEYVSDAASAYDTSAFPQVAGGLGFFHVTTDWVSGTWDQEPKIEPVPEFSSVLMDPLTEKLDGSDQRYGFIFDTPMSVEEFEEEHPDAEPIDFDNLKGLWRTDDKTVAIARYYYKVCEYETLYLVSMNGELDTLREKDKPALEEQLGYEIEEGDDLLDGVVRIVRKRKEKVNKVKFCKLNGQEVLEETDWLGEHIPIIPVYGKMVFNKGKRSVSGVIKNLRDPQRLINYTESSNTEYGALQPKSPYTGYDEVIEPYKDDWMQANNKNFPVLRGKAIWKNGVLLPLPQRQPPPQPSAAMQSQTTMALQHFKSVLGKVYDEGHNTLGAESGKALLAKERRSNVASFHYIDNQGKSIRQAGKILVDIIPKLYKGPQIKRIRGEDGEEDFVKLNQPTEIREKGQTYEGIYDLNAGRYDVSVYVGPSHSSKRQEGAEAIVQVIQAAPQLMEVAGDLMFKNMDWPGAQELSERIKKTMPPGIVDDEMTPEQLKLNQAQEALQAMQGQIELMQQKLDDKTRSENMNYDIDLKKIEIDERKVQIDEFKARVEAMKAQHDADLSSGEVAKLTNAVLDQQDQMNDMATAFQLYIENLEQQPPQEGGFFDSGNGMGDTQQPL